ncbi:MAG: nucleotidyltransferase domain-containing protein [Candidatus Caenarcaniphilales bacterium]|nr:nucleotidyltransferase domain-containing protein [Candidatus Caenarcaniphilales bacterium]
MRLSAHELNSIKEAVKSVDVDATVYLFGSRVDDTKKGGDIDLLIISEKIGFAEKSKILWTLYERIGEQKIDILLSKTGQETAFIEIALKKGKQL